jgi:DNA-binding transcriptional ArsR family regulator
MELLLNMNFVYTDEAQDIIENYKDILKILEEEDRRELEETLSKEEREEEICAQKCYIISHGLKY